MAIYMPEEKPPELPSAGSHVGICIRVVDLGTQPGMYGPRPQVQFSWELPEELMSDSRPFVVNRRCGLNSSRKGHLRDIVESWVGRVLTKSELGKFDLGELLGTTCQIGIKHETKEDRTYAVVTSVMKRSKGVAERLPPTNEAIGFSLADRPFRQFEYDKLPEWMRATIAKAPEYAAAIAPQPQGKGQITAGTKQRLKAILAADNPAPKPEPVVEDLDDEIPFE
jgi:hypothetical protein